MVILFFGHIINGVFLDDLELCCTPGSLAGTSTDSSFCQAVPSDATTGVFRFFEARINDQNVTVPFCDRGPQTLR